jgi:Cyclophilin type peptidyl-prolyl cis-trans isomerase/CLD
VPPHAAPLGIVVPPEPRCAQHFCCRAYVGMCPTGVLPPAGARVQVPKEYNNLPQLKGRAVLEMSYTLNESRESTKPVTRNSSIVLDGYNAPVSAGCFLDLVQQKWYDGMTVQRADGFVVQTGKPADGEYYVDPATGKPRLCAAARRRCLHCAGCCMPQ